MKFVLILLLATGHQAVNLRSFQPETAAPAPENAEPGAAPGGVEAAPEKAEPEAAPEKVEVDPCAEKLKDAGLESILDEIHFRIESCETPEGDLSPCKFKDLMKEVKNRKKDKTCKKPAAPAAAPATAPAASPAPPKTDKTTITTTTTTSCPDNFMDEIVDQANVEFDMLDTNNDSCISADEAAAPTQQQVADAEEQNQYYWNEAEVKKGGKKVKKKMAKRVKRADKNGDGCVSKDEIQNLKFAICDCDKQFAMMDQNGDGKISLKEGAEYVDEHMHHAALLYGKFADIFKAADADNSKFLSKAEFCKAGPRYKGDGNHENK